MSLNDSAASLAANQAAAQAAFHDSCNSSASFYDVEDLKPVDFSMEERIHPNMMMMMNNANHTNLNNTSGNNGGANNYNNWKL